MAFGTLSIAIEALAVGIGCVLLIHEHLDSHWTRNGEQLTGANLTLGRTSILLLGCSILVALVAMIFDKDRLLGILTLCLVVPILALMAGFQGIW
jgi:hypothetical protein